MTSYTQLNLTLCSQVTKNNTLFLFTTHAAVCVCACAWIVDDNGFFLLIITPTHRHLWHELLQNLSLVKVLMCWWLLNAQHNVTAALCYSWQPWCSILPPCFPWMLYSLGSHPPLYQSAHLVKNTVHSIYDVIWLAGCELCHVYSHIHTQTAPFIHLVKPSVSVRSQWQHVEWRKPKVLEHCRSPLLSQ